MKPWKITIGLVTIALIILVVPAVFAGAPGSGPGDPVRVTNTWQTLAPRSALWFYFDYTGDKSKIEATLENQGASNVQMAIFTPQQAQDWQADPTTKPVGIGTEPSDRSAMGIYDLTWRGAFNFAGRFYVVITNNNANPIQYRLNVTGESVMLAPPPSPTPVPTPLYATPISTANLQGRFLFQESSGGYIYTVNGDGSNLKRITVGIDPSWSPDSKQIAFTRWGNQAGVYVANIDGSNERAIVGSLTQPLSPRWSPDGTKIVYTRQWGGTLFDTSFCFGRFCFSSPAAPHWRLGTVDVNSKTVFDPRSSNFSFAPSWKTDNATIAYADANFGIMITNIKGDSEWTIYNQNPAVQSTVYSPDGKKIAFAVRQHDHWEVNVLDLDSGNVSAVTRTDPLAFRVTNNVAPTWSPDGKQVVFLSDRNGKWEFFAANVDGTNLTQVLKSVTDNINIFFNYSNERVIDWSK